eukprot:TRINITY_DN27411_c0_g1_i3.p1 TRINITY_DN27411_c0_g1~~TRINITY_DN27411_c0_g1_i3.p1  ORF type:complete len:480 (-),score=105.59 TRINITY_DN27411_c0_g1_i3:93-1532(-)
MAPLVKRLTVTALGVCLGHVHATDTSTASSSSSSRAPAERSAARTEQLPAEWRRLQVQPWDPQGVPTNPATAVQPAAVPPAAVQPAAAGMPPTVSAAPVGNPSLNEASVTVAPPLGGTKMPEDDPENLPSPSWPGATAAESNAAWPAGRQPHGWLGQCSDLQHKNGLNMHQCKTQCTNNPECSVWQYIPDSGCWSGRTTEFCDRGADRVPVQLQGAQRIQHGQVRKLKDLKGWEVSDLRPLGFYATGATPEGLDHCRSYCYSDLNCEYWIYGKDGCWVHDPSYERVQYPLTTSGGATMQGEFALSVVDGEYIQHYCPPGNGSSHQGNSGGKPDTSDADIDHTKEESKADVLPQGVWSVYPYIVFVGLLLGFAVCVLVTLAQSDFFEEAEEEDDSEAPKSRGPKTQRGLAIHPMNNEQRRGQSREANGHTTGRSSGGGNGRTNPSPSSFASAGSARSHVPLLPPDSARGLAATTPVRRGY